MKIFNNKYLLIFSILLNIGLIGWGGYTCFFQKKSRTNANYFDFIKYADWQHTYPTDTTTVIFFVGNSITANWLPTDMDFFLDNKFICKGSGGESSTQILLRFQHSVVNNDPDVVILNTGINDIGENEGFYREWFTLNNIQSMIDICKENDIEIILTSVLPATEVKLNRFKSVNNLHEKINNLNKKIFELSVNNDLIYVDYFSSLVDSNGNFDEKYTFDGVHPNKEGYKIMEKIILDVLKNIDHK